MSELTGPVLPWWRVPMVWLVVGGPAAVVVASFVTLTLAIVYGDVPLPHAAEPDAFKSTPAERARNHAATPQR